MSLPRALALVILPALAAAAPPCAITAAFGADPTTTATISFASNASDAGAFVTVSPPLAGGVTRVAAAAFDNSYANAAGVRVVYRAALAGLAPKTTYTYAPSVAGEAAAPRSFTTLSADTAADVPRVIFWGDLGRDGGGQAFPALEAEAAAAAARAPGCGAVGIQAGDFAYDLGDHDGARGAAFMERFSNISAFLPTFTVIGNHELPTDLPLDVNASHYVNMLGANMPGASNGSYYSVDVGLNHLVFLSSEVLALGPYGGVTVAAQSAWLAADLAAVDRAKTPWVVAILHRPFCASACAAPRVSAPGSAPKSSPLYPTRPSATLKQTAQTPTRGAAPLRGRRTPCASSSSRSFSRAASTSCSRATSTASS